jgi:hypothetical protein
MILKIVNKWIFVAEFYKSMFAIYDYSLKLIAKIVTQEPTEQIVEDRSNSDFVFVKFNNLNNVHVFNTN